MAQSELYLEVWQSHAGMDTAFLKVAYQAEQSVTEQSVEDIAVEFWEKTALHLAELLQLVGNSVEKNLLLQNVYFNKAQLSKEVAAMNLCFLLYKDLFT